MPQIKTMTLDKKPVAPRRAVTLRQTVEVPASHRLTIDVPREIPAGTVRVVIQFPVTDEEQTDVPQEAKGQINNEAFREALRRAYGAWKDNPWRDHLEDINAMRDEWDHRDPWNPDSAKRHRDCNE